MSPVYNFLCSCGKTEERIVHYSVESVSCSTCNGVSMRQFTPPSRHDGSIEAPAWLRTTLDVVDRNSTKPHVRAFVENPTRKTYQAWMKGEKIKPVDYTEHGGPPVYRKPETVDTKRIAQELYEKHRARKAIEVRG